MKSIHLFINVVTFLQIFSKDDIIFIIAYDHYDAINKYFGGGFMSKYKIGCLTYKKLNYLTENAIAKINDASIDIMLIEGLMENLTDKVNEALREGVDVFIGGGANAATISKSTEAYVVEIKLTAFDYIDAIIEARKIGRRIAVVHFEEAPVFNYKKLENLLDVEILDISFEQSQELEAKLNETEAEVVVGASLSNEIANRNKIPSILIYPGEDAVINAIIEAKNIAIALRREREKSKIIQAILDFSPSGVIATDEESKIIMFNPAAEKMVGVHAFKAKGSPVNQILPECQLDSVLEEKQPHLNVINKVNNKDIVVSRIPIEIKGDIVGTVAIMNPVSEIQKTEQKIRMLNNKRGFTSKMKFSNIVGESKIIKEKIKEAKIYSKSNSNILIYGETGVGKEIFAQSIHNYGSKMKGPFVAINCAALPESILESELFGYEEGAFTGSKKGGKAGLFEIAHGGTILLDEIGELPLSLQSRLLRVLQEKEVIRLGGDHIIPINIRVIAATNKNLEKRVPNEFRNDLLYRLNVLQLKIPPLRNRENDVIALFLHFLNKYSTITQYKKEIPPSVLKVLNHYSWPGNIRELQNVSERFSLFQQETTRTDENAYKEMLVRSIGEERIIEDVLEQNGIPVGDNIKSKSITNEIISELNYLLPGKKLKIAEVLGISRTTLWRIDSK